MVVFFFKMVEFFLEKNTTKFENPLAHIKNTLRAHQMCAHITLGSPGVKWTLEEAAMGNKTTCAWLNSN